MVVGIVVSYFVDFSLLQFLFLIAYKSENTENPNKAKKDYGTQKLDSMVNQEAAGFWWIRPSQDE